MVGAIRRSGVPHDAAEDIAQQVLMRLQERLERSVQLRNELAWISVVAGNAVAAWHAGELRTRDIQEEFLAKAVGGIPSHEDEVTARELVEHAIKTLPPPYAQILDLEGRKGRGRQTIIRFLHTWRGVGDRRARKLIQEAHEMMREVAAGEDPRQAHEKRFSKKSPWSDSDPPPFDAL